ncbi:Inositol phosphosphingolipid phospholipase [Wickerhamomyces ciferrii]|uniref:Inositol phosphosphingolipid phospholipase n=1 Tax=Wickerhamomyces ciferrii (strain ATCC 14091 / BCRC 22168 / CBS 111 / JCM 3599 / NBRC 0793 / NRRL Y-1031 F-60-10) TaxID=1206466 RepID=K0KWE7_WICCF|nr:Inositol phosphosphingolipid phospholipase [Wickerhamomyces ciferrii]CCH45814.1 Inositol phosphosphingolipid phospholipase [Wickerhamomyces ciferrii]
MVMSESESDLLKPEGHSAKPGSGSKIKFLTLNTWGLKFVSKFRKDRLRAIGDKIRLEHFKYDVIALQEVWCKEDWDYIEETVSDFFPYRRIFYSGIITGPGLAILSKIPIDSTFLYRFPINGRPSAFWRGDWFVGKSVAVTLLRPLDDDSFPLAILNSHMHAPYSLEGDAAYTCHRSCQAWDFAKLSKLLSKAGYAVVIVGDLNSRPGSLPHKFLTLETTLIDSWEQLNGVQDLNKIKNLSPDLQIEIGGTTCDSTLNTWRSNRHPTEACRLDYALIDSSKLKTLEAKVDFTEQIPEIGSYSDHFAYSCTLQISSKNSYKSLTRSNSITVNTVEYYDEMLELLRNYNKTAKWQKSWRGWHFILSIVLLIIIHIVAPFTSQRASWSSVFWVFSATIISITGLIDGLISYLFGRSEIRALEEVKQEVLDAKRSLQTIVYN